MSSRQEAEQFDQILEKVIEDLPDDVKEMLSELPVIVEDEPSPQLLKEMGITARRGEADLCGIHTGIPIKDQSVFDSPLVPQNIYLFRGPILRLAGWKPKALAKQIRITLLHEIGHHFGLTEEELTELGYE